jgi:Predicted transcriptional regulators
MFYVLKSDALDKARQIHGLTSDEKLAATLGVTSQTVRNLRNGKYTPSVATLVRIRDLVGGPIDDLIVERKAESAPAA